MVDLNARTCSVQNHCQGLAVLSWDLHWTMLEKMTRQTPTCARSAERGGEKRKERGKRVLRLLRRGQATEDRVGGCSELGERRKRKEGRVLSHSGCLRAYVEEEMGPTRSKHGRPLAGWTPARQNSAEQVQAGWKPTRRSFPTPRRSLSTTRPQRSTRRTMASARRVGCSTRRQYPNVEG